MVDIFHFIVSTDVVDYADAALVDDQIDGLAVVLDVQPITDVLAFAVDWQRFVFQAVCDHQRDQLLWEEIRSVIVRASADAHQQPVGAVILSKKFS